MMTLTQRLSPSNPFTVFERAEIEQGIHQRFEKQAARFAHRVAVREQEGVWTYESLNRAANNIASAISKQANPSSGQIGFVLPNGAIAISTLLGILKAGKAYVPLDPSFPKDRLCFMAEHAECGLILADHEHRDLAREISGGRLPIALIEEIDLKQPCDDPERPVDPGSLAYILFTSGSTGKPKGIAFGHRNLLHTTMCLTNNLHISEEDRLTQLHSTSFAASVVDIYCSLLNGASVYPWDVKIRGVAGLAKWLMEEKVTSIQWIPTPFRHLMESLNPGEIFESVRLVVMASEPLTRREFNLFCRHFPDQCFLVNQIGTSESYNYGLFFANKETTFDGSIVPAGYPVSEDREILLLNEQREEVEPGEVGEIGIRSKYMSLGYWRNPELTRKVFLQDRDDPEKKIYLTGDVGKYLEDGCLLHMGRKDFQVKIRGYRIELPEVELAIKSLGGIRDVAVVARPDHAGEMKLVAYYIAHQDKDLSVTELVRSLKAKLPDYMVPHIFIRMREFPMTPSGKLDRNSLPSPTESRPLLDNALIAPRDEIEQVLCDIWKEILGREELGVMDSFFELGGDSLQAARMLHLVSVRCGVDLKYSSLVQAPRIADLAARVQQATARSGTGEAPQEQEAEGYRENPFRGLFNRFLQVLALYAPGLTSLRVWLHRLRGVRIGKNVAIGTAAIIETARPELVSIGNNVAIGIRNVLIGHFSDCIDRNAKSTEPTLRICDNVYLGPNVTVLPNVTIGEGSVVAAGSVVTKSVPPRTMVQGNPARPVAICGVPLVGEGRSYEEFLKHIRPLKGVDGAVEQEGS